MNRMLVLRLAWLLAAAWPAAASAEMLSAWVQHTATGLEARIVTDEARCPTLTIGSRAVAMRERAPPSAAFPGRVCSAPGTSGSQPIAIGSTVLPSRISAPIRLVVVGDTGCRITETVQQACNNPAMWPWAQVAARAAAMRPDLVIHV